MAYKLIAYRLTDAVHNKSTAYTIPRKLAKNSTILDYDTEWLIGNLRLVQLVTIANTLVTLKTEKLGYFNQFK